MRSTFVAAALAGIYIHIPFCRKACTYCDFHFSTGLQTVPLLVKALAEEIYRRAAYLAERDLQSIYIGGGTPSLLQEKELAIIFEQLYKHFAWDKSAELTIEANPDDISSSMLDTWKKFGINRISLGLQSFNDEELRWMNRAHTAAQGLDAVKRAQDTGFENISLDLIYGSRFQDDNSWAQTLQTVIDLNVPHISSYNLTVEQKTLLYHNIKHGIEPPVNETLSARQFNSMSDFLADNGFLHYEVSNFARPGREAVHNSNYWKQKPYLGIGPSAHSFDGASRQWNVRNNLQYIKALQEGGNFSEREELTVKDRYNEYILTRLRTMWGCDMREIEENFGAGALSHFKKGIKLKGGLFITQNNVVTLSKEAKLLADGLASDLFLL